MASGFDVLMFIYTCGVTGSAIGLLLFRPPKNSNDLFDNFTRCLLWPLDVYHSYKQSLAERRQITMVMNAANVLAHQTIAIKRLTENLDFERDRYHKLLIDYKRLKAESEKSTTLNGARVVTYKDPDNEQA